jgi:parvulin-like peptidyl-prolyl isomerase
MPDRRIHLHLSGILTGVLLIACVTGHAGVGVQQFIDRMVAVVDGDVVTQGDVEDFRQLGDFFGDAVPDEDGEVLNRLIENILIARLMGQFTRAPIEDAAVEDYLRQFGVSDQLPSEVLHSEARRRIERAVYFESIRRSRRVSPEETRALYESDYVSEQRARGVEVIPPLFEVADELSEVIRDIKLNEEIEARLERLYRSYQVEVVE